MKLNENDIKKMVSESVAKLLKEYSYVDNGGRLSSYEAQGLYNETIEHNLLDAITEVLSAHEELPEKDEFLSYLNDNKDRLNVSIELVADYDSDMDFDSLPEPKIANVDCSDAISCVEEYEGASEEKEIAISTIEHFKDKIQTQGVPEDEVENEPNPEDILGENWDASNHMIGGGWDSWKATITHDITSELEEQLEDDEYWQTVPEEEINKFWEYINADSRGCLDITFHLDVAYDESVGYGTKSSPVVDVDSYDDEEAKSYIMAFDGPEMMKRIALEALSRAIDEFSESEALESEYSEQEGDDYDF